MKYALLAALGAAAVVAFKADAAELTGGTFTLGYSAYTDETSFSRLALKGSGELLFTDSFGVQLDLGVYDFNRASQSDNNFGLHALFHSDDVTTLGLFAGRDSIANTDVDFLGIEAGVDLPNGVGGEFYLGRLDENTADGTLIGVGFAHSLNYQWDFNADVKHATFDGQNQFTRASIGVGFNPSDTTNLYAELGSFRGKGYGLNSTEGFIELGARFDFGSEGGTVFSPRGVLDMIPGR